jgi:hypothetical protein
MFTAAIFALSVAPATFAAELTLRVYPSPTGVSWKSPRRLAWSVVVNSLASSPFTRPHEIGHVSVELQCEGPGPRVYAGMTSAESTTERRLLLRDQIGLGILFYTFDGKLDGEAEIRPDWEERREKGHGSWITFVIRDETCQRLRQYHAEYQARGLQQFYGLPLRPRQGEGAGCSAFAASFLELAGVLDDEFREGWSGTRLVPTRWIGGNGRRVNLASILLRWSATRWADESEPHVPIFFWDPDMMHRWIMAKWKEENSRATGDAIPGVERRTKGLIYDRTGVPTPTDPIWEVP